MPIGTPPLDIYHNGEWYSRNGGPAAGVQLIARSNVLIPLTGTVAATTMLEVACPGLTPGDSIRVTGKLAFTNNANNKTMQWYYGIGDLGNQVVFSSVASAVFDFSLDVRGLTTQHIVGNDTQQGAASATAFRSGVLSNLNVPFNIAFVGQLASAGDQMNIETYYVSLIRG